SNRILRDAPVGAGILGSLTGADVVTILMSGRSGLMSAAGPPSMLSVLKIAFTDDEVGAVRMNSTRPAGGTSTSVRVTVVPLWVPSFEPVGPPSYATTCSGCTTPS